MLTVRGPDAVPLVGETWSQLPPAFVETVAANVAVPPVLVSVSVWDAGALPPCTCVDLMGLAAVPAGETVTTVLGVTVRVSGTVMEFPGILPEAITIAP